MNLSDIKAFLAVVQKGSLTDAAQHLHITQPTLTHRIQLLENELRAPLFVRGKGIRRVELTNAGRGFIPIAEKWIRLWEETSTVLSRAERKTFSVATSHSISNYLMPLVYSKFLSRNLPISLSIKTFHSQEAYDSLEYGDTDMALIANTQFSKRVSSIPVFEEPMVLLCSIDALYQNNLHPSELPAEKGIYMNWTHEYSLWHEYWFGVGCWNVESESVRLIECIVAESDYWAVVPYYVAKTAVKNGGLKFLPLQNGPPPRITYLLTMTPEHEYTQLLIDDLRSVISEL